MINGLTLKQLRYFSALAQLRHFAQAAEACAISQPALSLQIKQLEEMVGAPLVERTTRHVHLTSLGKEIAHKADEVLRTVGEIDDVVRAAKDEFSGLLRLGVIPTIAPYLLPEVMQRLTLRYPKLDVVLRETITPQIIVELQEGQLDAAVVALPIPDPSFTQKPLFTENFVFVRPRSQTGLPIPDLAALRDMKLLLLAEGHCFRDQALAFCEVESKGNRNILEGSSLTTLVQLVASGVGVTVIPEMAARLEAKIAEVEMVYFDDPQPSRSVGMVWRKTSPIEPQLLAMSEIVADAASSLREPETVD